MTAAQRRLTGRIHVALPPAEALRLFTPRGEQDWAHGWHPRFPAPAPDDTEPGTVFETTAHGQHTVWLVTEHQPGRRISYARVTPADQAGTVTVTVTAAAATHADADADATDVDASQHSAAGQHTAAGQHSAVDVTYHLTALTGPAVGKLGEFADRYPAYLQSWQDAITAWLRHADSRT
jgi:hypothetical protein